MGGKIPVTVVSGFLGSGKTTLLNRLLSDSAPDPAAAFAPSRIVVLINELGDIGLDHERFVQLDDHMVLLESGCICCAVRGDLVNALQRLFLDALHRKIPPFSALVIETTGIADPAPIMYTLQYERFLADRYAYAGCITVVDGLHGATQLQSQPEAAQQAVLADVFVLSKADLVDPDTLAALQAALERINPGAPQYRMQALPSPGALLRMASERQGGMPRQDGARAWADRVAGRQASAHTGVGVLTMMWERPLDRPAFNRAMPGLLAQEGMLRLKGKVHFQDKPGVFAVHAVHQQLYPIEAIESEAAAPPRGPGHEEQGAPAECASVLVLIFRGVDEAGLLSQIRALLPGGARILSSDGNFIQ